MSDGADALDGSKGPVGRPTSDLYSAAVDGPPLTIALLALGYLIGALPMGVIVARLSGGTDPRTVGTGRTGSTNARRAMGAARGMAVALLDVLKGAAPILIARLLGADVALQALTGVAAVAGSWKSVYIGFGGGRGVGTWFGGLIVASPLVAVLCLPLYAVIIRWTGLISLASLMATVLVVAVVAALAAVGSLDPAWLLYVTPSAAIIWRAHRENIGRIRAGTEPRVDRGVPGAPRTKGAR